MNFLSLIEAKREGRHLSPLQVGEIIEAYTSGRLPDYQVAAFLMAVYFQGLDPAETTALTLAMRDSGDVLQFPKHDPRPVVDKHSTGGVGDKVSLPLAPLLACLGFRVPMISGRGLGITGGTLDKLDSIPGLRTVLSQGEILDLVNSVGCVICGQTEQMVPADKGLYALRDVTGTVPSIPLIVASILSKKLAEGLQALILDVKFGSAAFMTTINQARQLARAMVRLGNECGVRTRAFLSSMDTPLGASAGNWLEIKESIACLDCKGPPDLADLVLACAAELLVQTGKAQSRQSALDTAKACLESGRPRQKWDQMVEAQGANLDQVNHLLSIDSTAPIVLEVRAPRSGFVAHCDARTVGELIRDLGGGRLTKESAISYGVGVDRLAQVGQPVQTGECLGRVHAMNSTQAETAGTRLQGAFCLADAPTPARCRIVEYLD